MKEGNHNFKQFERIKLSKCKAMIINATVKEEKSLYKGTRGYGKNYYKSST